MWVCGGCVVSVASVCWVCGLPVRLWGCVYEGWAGGGGVANTEFLFVLGFSVLRLSGYSSVWLSSPLGRCPVDPGSGLRFVADRVLAGVVCRRCLCIRFA